MSLPTVGIIELVSIGKRAIDVPAKIDTGADSSAIWASNVRVGRDGVLRFSLFGEGSPYYNGKIFKRTDFSVSKVKSSNGSSEIRYRTHFVVMIAGRRVKILMSLADRSNNEFAILIGRRTIAGKFLVDVRKKPTLSVLKRKNGGWNEEFKKDPYAFHKRYVKENKVGL